MTLRQFPGRPDVAIRLSLALEKLTYLCQKQAQNLLQLIHLLIGPDSLTVHCSAHSWEWGTREVKLYEVHGGCGCQEQGVWVRPSRLYCNSWQISKLEIWRNTAGILIETRRLRVGGMSHSPLRGLVQVRTRWAGRQPRISGQSAPWKDSVSVF